MTILGISTIPPASVVVVAAPYAPAGPIVVGTSSTENDIGLGGTYVFQVDQVGLGFMPGLRVRASVADDATTWVEGVVSAFDGVNLTVVTDLSHGTGVHDSWNIGIAGEPGQKGQKGDTGAQGPIGPGGGVPADSPTFTGDPKAPTPVPGDNDNSIATTQYVMTALVNYQRFDPDLEALAALTGTGVIYYRSAPDTWAAVTIGAGITFTGGTLSAGGMAPLDSPTFTGNPQAPTPTAGDADTSIATTGFVAASFAPLASPILTGTPKAPTAAPGTNDTTIASTAFVQAALAAGYQPLDADLTALAGLTGTNVFFYRSAASTWAPVVIGANMLFSGGTLSSTGSSGGGGVPADSPVFTGDPQAPTPPPGDNDASLATTAFVQGELAAKANIASPSFTGAPLAPTPTAGDSTLKIATTAFVGTAVGAVSTALASKADLASPVFTGDPKAPTPTAGDNDTSVATTAFTKTAIDNFSTTVTATFAPIASPIFTGSPKSVTPATASNDTSIATTAYVKANLAGYLPTTGGNLTGALAIITPAPTVGLYKTGGNSAAFGSYNSATGQPRWFFVLGSGEAETGGNVGSNFSIDRYSDAGAFLSSPIKINRATGVVEIAGVTDSGAAGRRVLIQSQTVSAAVASVAFTTGLDATYDQYELDFFNVHPASEAQLNLHISQDGGATWKTDANYQIAGFLVGAVGSPAWLQNSVSSAIVAAITGVSPLSNGAQSGLICFARPSAAEFHLCRIDSVNHSSSGSISRWGGTGAYVGNALAFNGLRFTANGGFNLVSGTFNLYGIKK